MNRINFLKTILAGTLGSTINVAKANEIFTAAEPFSLPKLAFDYNALEPNIDAMTMEIHYSKHHQGYVNNLNKAVIGTPLEGKSLEEILKSISKQSVAVRNNGGGHWNHTFFWSILSPNKTSPSQFLQNAIAKDFGTIENMKTEFNTAAGSRFGSGWAWLVAKNGKLSICSTPNQDNPLMDIAETKGTPIIGIDVWEHAYYLKYQNKRADYVKAFWDVLNWEAVENKLKKA